MRYPKLKDNGYVYHVEKKHDGTFVICKSGNWRTSEVQFCGGFFSVPIFYSGIQAYRYMKENLADLA